MLNPPKKTKIKAEPGIGGATHERGKSFIQAVRGVILLYLTEDQIHTINAQPQKDFPLKNHPGENKSNFALLQEYMLLLEEYWNNRDPKTLQPNDLAALERTLIEAISENVYLNKRKDGKVDSKHFNKIKMELDNAENHLNWKSRDEKNTQVKEDGISMSRTETPISAFTTELTEEWLKITSIKSQQPAWFLALPTWEQEYLKARVQEWRYTIPIVRNLGDVLGPVPTTIRRYPGAPNAYVTNVTLTNNSIGESQQFTKIRSGVIVPVKMKANNKKQQEEKVKMTKLALEQLIVVAIKEKIDALGKSGRVSDPKNATIKLPILFQTLYSPPAQPPGKYNNEALMKALDLVRKDLASGVGIQEFITKHEIKTNGINLFKIDLLYSNRAVNKARGISWFTNLFNRQGSESRKTDKALATYIKNMPDSHDKAIAQAALERYQTMPYIANTLNGIRDTSSNAMAEKAALEQIISGKIGFRIGSCVSGKDREEMITEIAIAQQEFFLKHNAFPPHYNATGKKDKELREEFMEGVARQYLTGHGHELAAENSKGCDGLKNIRDVFGKDICQKIQDIGEREYGIDPSKFDPIKDVQRVAGLNKLSTKKLDVDNKPFMEKVATFDRHKRVPKTWVSATPGGGKPQNIASPEMTPSPLQAEFTEAQKKKLK